MTAGGATTGFRIRQVILAVAVLTAVVVVVPVARAARAEASHSTTFAPGDVLVGVNPRYTSGEATVLNDDYLVGMQWRDRNGRPPVTGVTECSALADLSCLPGTTSTAAAGLPGQPGLVAKRQQQAAQVELAYAEVEDGPESLSASGRSPEVPVGVLPGVAGAGLLLFGFGLSGRRKQQRRPVQVRETATGSSGRARDVDFERRHWR